MREVRAGRQHCTSYFGTLCVGLFVADGNARLLAISSSRVMLKRRLSLSQRPRRSLSAAQEPHSAFGGG
jgi:hypothetical protein